MNGEKYFFFDIDGTLIPYVENQEIPQTTLDAIDTLRKRGNFCAVATGRPQYSASKICQEMGFDNYVSDGGNGVTIGGELKCLFPMPHNECIILANECDKLRYPWAISTDNQPFYCSKSQDEVKELSVERK